MEEDDAEKAYKDYLAITKTRKEKYLEDLKKVYYALKNGKKVIDIFAAFKNTGVTETGDPKLAIAPANCKTILFKKESGGAGWFAHNNSGWRESNIDVRLPGNTFPEWKLINPKERSVAWNLERRDITTKVPIIPAHLMPPGDLSKYYILWEVDEWNEIAKVQDPFLLKRINVNTFLVLAAWDLTEVEQIVMRGN